MKKATRQRTYSRLNNMTGLGSSNLQTKPYPYDSTPIRANIIGGYQIAYGQIPIVDFVRIACALKKFSDKAHYTVKGVDRESVDSTGERNNGIGLNRQINDSYKLKLEAGYAKKAGLSINRSILDNETVSVDDSPWYRIRSDRVELFWNTSGS